MVADPAGVASAIRPVVAPNGTVAPKDVAVAVFVWPSVTLKVSLSLAGVVSKFVPVIVTLDDCAAIVGEKLVMLGVVLAITKNDDALVAEPLGVVTASGPVVAPAGTVAMS